MRFTPLSRAFAHSLSCIWWVRRGGPLKQQLQTFGGRGKMPLCADDFLLVGVSFTQVCAELHLAQHRRVVQKKPLTIIWTTPCTSER